MLLNMFKYKHVLLMPEIIHRDSGVLDVLGFEIGCSR